MENPSPKAENTLCERVQDALISETPLDGEQTRHLESCDACRTYREQLKRMRTDLAALQVPTLTDKDGTGVADAVMEEIRRQALFGRSPGALRKKLFRHAGLAAACFIVLVMAAPVVFHMWLPAHNAETSADSAAPSARMGWTRRRCSGATWRTTCRCWRTAVRRRRRPEPPVFFFSMSHPSTKPKNH